MLAWIRGAVIFVSVAAGTFVFGSVCILAALLRFPDRPGAPFDWAPRYWGRVQLWLGGVRVVEHGVEHKAGARHIFVANHLGNFDIFALASVLPWMKFVAKAELFRIPIMGPAMVRAGMIPVERASRTQSFQAYRAAQARIDAGASVAVYPEGTRGTAYALRPFKKGPFVLAIQAQAPIVPVYIHGVLEIQRKHEFRVRPGTIHVHYLPAIPTQGLTYDDRTTLARRAYEAMAACAAGTYGVVSPPFGSR